MPVANKRRRHCRNTGGGRRRRVSSANALDNTFCYNCYRKNVSRKIVGIDTHVLRRLFCNVDRSIFKEHNRDGELRVSICKLCREVLQIENYQENDSSYEEGNTTMDEEWPIEESLWKSPDQPAINRLWSVAWPAFYWRLLNSEKLMLQIGHKAWCLVPSEWRFWWVETLKSHNLIYENITLDYPKSVIRDATKKQELGARLHDQLKSKDIDEHLDDVLECKICCPWGCSEFAFKAHSLPLDILIARSFGLTTEDIAFVTKDPASAIDKKVRGIREDWLTYPMDHNMSWMLNPDPNAEVLPSISCSEGYPAFLVCRECEGGSKKMRLYPPRNPLKIFSNPRGEQLAPVAMRSRLLKPGRASAFSNKHQMLHMQGHINGVDSGRVTSDIKFEGQAPIGVPYTSLMLCGREDMMVFVNSLFGEDGDLPAFIGDEVLKRSQQCRPVEQYTDSYSSATFICAETALLLEMEGKYKRNPVYSNHVTSQLKHFSPCWPSVIPYVHTNNSYGCKPCCGLSLQKNACTNFKLIWVFLATLACHDTIWTQLGSLPSYKDDGALGYMMSYSAKFFLPQLAKSMYRGYPFKVEENTSARVVLEQLDAMFVNACPTYDQELDNAEPLNTSEPLSMKRLFGSVIAEGCSFADRFAYVEDFPLTRSEYERTISENRDNDVIVMFGPYVLLDYALDEFMSWEVRTVLLKDNNSELPYIHTRFGGSQFHHFWKINSKNKFVTKVPQVWNPVGEEIGMIVVCKNKAQDSEKMRQDFLCSIGGQNKIYCECHDLPLITMAREVVDNSGADGNRVNEHPHCLCCNYKDQGNSSSRCSRYLTYTCPEANCATCICSTHFKEATRRAGSCEEGIVRIGLTPTQREANSTGDEAITFENGSVEQDLEFEDSISEQCSEQTLADLANLDDISHQGYFPPNSREMSDTEDGFVLPGYVDFEDLYDDSIDDEQAVLLSDEGNPACGYSTTARLVDPIRNVMKKCVTSISGSVILNNCGTLLARGYRKLKATAWQCNFLQRIVATCPGRAVPLLYAEGTLFPSIFWKDDDCGGILGAIPTALMACDKTLNEYGIESVQKQLIGRLTAVGPDMSTSENQDYICYSYDCLANLGCRGDDTRLVMRRGTRNKKTGLKKVDENLMFDTDSIESRPHVNMLCAKMKEDGATYFGSHSANHKDHFGLRKVKRWIDSDELYAMVLERVLEFGVNDNIVVEEDIKEAIRNASAVTLLRHWMETTELYMKYICHSPEQPLGKVLHAWYRHEYQESEGNLSHLHYLLWIDRSQEDDSTTMNRIRGSVMSLVTPEDLEGFKADGMDVTPETLFELRDHAEKVLLHICSQRCKKRVGTDGELRCRVPDIGLESSDYRNHVIDEVKVNHTSVCKDILKEIGLLTLVTSDEDDSEEEVYHESLRAYKHYPSCVPSDGIMSPCNSKLFALTKSNQNLTLVKGYFGARYVAKYSAKIDEANRVYFGASQDDRNAVTIDLEFLHNTKITGSAINGQKMAAKRRDKNHPSGRAISMMEIIAVSLGYEMVATNIIFCKIPTKPLGERMGVAITPLAPTYDPTRTTPSDLDANELLTAYAVRSQMHSMQPQQLDAWQTLSHSESIILRDCAMSDVSIDKITLFSVRPPELRFVRRVKDYYRWFYRASELVGGSGCCRPKQVEELRKRLHKDINLTCWIDGFGHQVFVRPDGLQEVCDYLRNLSVTSDDRCFHSFDDRDGCNSSCGQYRKITKMWMCLNNLKEKMEEYRKEAILVNEDECELIQRLVGPCGKRNGDRRIQVLPVVYYDPIPPMQSHRFLIHLLLVMGKFDNELNLMSQPSIKKCFIYAGLILVEGENDSVMLENSCRKLLKRYILEELVFQPAGTKQFDRCVVAAKQAIWEGIIHDAMATCEMPSVLFTSLCKSINNSGQKFINKTRRTLAHTVLENLNTKNIKLGLSEEAITMEATLAHPVDFGYKLQKGDGQSDNSFDEQERIFQFGVERFESYCSATKSTPKSLIINGGPGTGKTTLMELLISYAMAKGLYCVLTAVMSERACQLGGIHISRLMSIPVRDNASSGRLAEMAYLDLMRHPDRLELLRVMDVMFIDEFGQVSSELLSIMDMIMRRVRNSSQFMGGVLIVSTYDYMQLPPVKGYPPLLSPYILTSFMLTKLVYSVRAGKDAALRKIQDSTRLSPADFRLERNEFVTAIKTKCTFVESFDDEKIDPSMLRMFGKRSAAKVAMDKLLCQMKNLYGNSIVIANARDEESTLESTCFRDASEPTSRALDRAVKEPRQLVFYPGALYEVTFNKQGCFNQTQLAILRIMPTQSDIDSNQPISVYLAPPGCKSVPRGVNADNISELGEEPYNWSPTTIAFCEGRATTLHNGIQAKRCQYGLKPRIASTIHSGMGQDLPAIVTRVTDCATENGIYYLWSKEQIIVLLSRTHYAKDIIFVGDPEKTANAIADCLERVSQFTDYMTHIMNTLSNPSSTAATTLVDPFTYHPFRMCDYNIPTHMGSFCYNLVSLGDPTHTTSYIGETNNLAHRLIMHNQRKGALTTRDTMLIPWALLGFVVGFKTNERSERQSFETRWEADRVKLARTRRLQPDDIAGIAVNIIASNPEKYSHLKYVRCGKACGDHTVHL